MGADEFDFLEKGKVWPFPSPQGTVQRVLYESQRTWAEQEQLRRMRDYVRGERGFPSSPRLTPEGEKMVRIDGGPPQWPMPVAGRYGCLAVIMGWATEEERAKMTQWQVRQDRLSRFLESSILVAIQQDYWWDILTVAVDNDTQAIGYRFFRYVDRGQGHKPEKVGYYFGVLYHDILRGLTVPRDTTQGAGLNYAMRDFTNNLEQAKLATGNAVRGY